MANIWLQVFFFVSLLIGAKLNGNCTPLRNDYQSGSRHVDVFTNLLYWYTSETVDWGHVLTSGSNFVDDSYKTLSFDWCPGFRVGFLYHSPHDCWNTQISYTWFQSRASAQNSGPITSGFLAARLSLLEPFGNGEMQSNLHYNMFDWDLGRNFLVCQSLSMRPFIGLKAGWINQDIDILWTTPDFIIPGFLFSATENVKNNFLGAGPKIGVNGKFVLNHYSKSKLSLIAGLEGAFLWGHWTLKDDFIDIFDTEISIPAEDRNFGSLVLQATMGIGWDFCLNKRDMALNIYYEIQNFFNYFQVFTNDSGTDNFGLTVQGITVDLRIKF